jgi:hypothetical protein
MSVIAAIAGRARKIEIQGQSQQSEPETPSEKQTKNKGAGGVAQIVKHLFSKHRP